MLRIVVGAFAWLYLVVRARVFLSLRSADPGRFDPVGVLAPLSTPPTSALVVTCYVLAVAAGAAFVTGLWFRASGPLFGVTLLLLTTYRSSWGQILWLENLVVIHVLIVGLARSADVWSWRPFETRHAAPEPAETYGAPVRLAALVTVATYVLAGIAKLRYSGIDWVTSDTLRNHVAASVVRAELLDAPASPIGRRLVADGWLFPPAAALSLLLELAAPIAFLGRRLRDVWVASAWLMHASIAALMFVVFPYPLFFVAFAPLYDLERAVTRAIRWRRDRARGGRGGRPS
jgi:hypothetical protein